MKKLFLHDKSYARKYLNWNELNKEITFVYLYFFGLNKEFERYHLGFLWTTKLGIRDNHMIKQLAKLTERNVLLLKWFLSIALCIPTGHDFRVIAARKWACARTQGKKFPSSLAR